jgi:hypothetical protein
VLSGRGLCDKLITRPEESYQLRCVVVCDLETSRIGAPYIYTHTHIYDISSRRVKVCRGSRCLAPCVVLTWTLDLGEWSTSHLDHYLPWTNPWNPLNRRLCGFGCSIFCGKCRWCCAWGTVQCGLTGEGGHC